MIDVYPRWIWFLRDLYRALIKRRGERSDSNLESLSSMMTILGTLTGSYQITFPTHFPFLKVDFSYITWFLVTPKWPKWEILWKREITEVLKSLQIVTLAIFMKIIFFACPDGMKTGWTVPLDVNYIKRLIHFTRKCSDQFQFLLFGVSNVSNCKCDLPCDLKFGIRFKIEY